MNCRNISGRKHLTMLNALSMISYQLLTVLLGFIIPQLLLKTYGPDIHGYTSTVTTVMGYVALLNMGLSTAAIQSLYQPLANHDSIRLSEVLNSINRLYIKTGVLYGVAVIGCAAVLPFIIKADIKTSEIVLLMLVTGATSILECLVYSKHRTLLQADQKLFVVTLVDLAALALRGGIQIGLMLTSSSIVFVQGVPLAMVLIRMLALSRYVSRHYPNLNSAQPPDFSALSKRRSVFAHQVAGLISTNTDVVILSVLGTMKAVSVYSVYNLVFSHLYTLITNVFSYGVLASFGQVIAEGKREVLLKAYEKYEFTYYMFIAIVYSTTTTLILPFVRLYTAGVEGVVYENFWFAVLFVAVGIANNLRVPCNTMITASGHFKETSWRAILEAAINMTVSLCLYPSMGIYGLLLGTLASFLYRTTDTIRYSNKYILHRPYKTSILRLLRVLLLIVLNITLFSMVVPLKTNTWLEWFIAALLVFCTCSLTTFLINALFEYQQMTETIRYILSGLQVGKKIH